MKSLKKTPDDSIISSAPQKKAAVLKNDEADNIAKHFSNYLKPRLAKTDQLKHEVYQLRYQVYCEELQFEEANQQRTEQDEFDLRSLHCFIRHASSGALAGTLRVIITRNNDELLPMEKFCPQAISDENLRPRHFLPHQICEVSRLAVPLAFRKRQADQFTGGATGAINEQTFSTHELRFFPYIAISLYLSAIALCQKSRIHHAFVMMEPRLARSMSFVGIRFTQIGEPVEYHGKRAAYYVDVRQLRKRLSIGYRNLLKMIEKELFS